MKVKDVQHAYIALQETNERLRVEAQELRERVAHLDECVARLEGRMSARAEIISNLSDKVEAANLRAQKAESRLAAIVAVLSDGGAA